MRRLALAIAFISFGCLPMQASDWVTLAQSGPAPLPSTAEPGSSLVIENWKCTIQSEKAIRCDNTTDYCVKLSERVTAFNKRIFGCAIKGNVNYPCDWSEIDPRRDGDDKSEAGQWRMFRYNYTVCGPHGVGSYTID